MYNVFATQLTDSGKTAQLVRWGDDGSRNWVTIGEASQTWSYPQVNITDLQTGHSGYSTNWGNGWVVNFGSIPGGQSTSRTASLVLTSNNASSYSSIQHGINGGDASGTGSQTASAYIKLAASDYVDFRSQSGSVTAYNSDHSSFSGILIG
jgi:hypothetical protein